jgi:hypothetical protein
MVLRRTQAAWSFGMSRVFQVLRFGVTPARGISRAKSCSGNVRISVGPPRGWKHCST